jgi:hypothetical protein
VKKAIVKFDLRLIQMKKGYCIILVALPLLMRPQRISNVDLSVHSNTVIVTYDLDSCMKKTCADVSLRFADEQGREIAPYRLKGDVTGVMPGKAKRIEWSALEDTSRLDTRLKAMIDIREIHSTKIAGGPSCALLSAVLPGLGDYYADDKWQNRPFYFYPHFIALGYCIGLNATRNAYNGLQSAKSNWTYLNHQPGTSVSDLANSSSAIRSAHHDLIVAAAVTGAIWLGDVIYVAIKGCNNKKKQLEAIHPRQNQIYVNPSPGNMGISFRRNF